MKQAATFAFGIILGVLSVGAVGYWYYVQHYGEEDTTEDAL